MKIADDVVVKLLMELVADSAMATRGNMVLRGAQSSPLPLFAFAVARLKLQPRSL